MSRDIELAQSKLGALSRLLDVEVGLAVPAHRLGLGQVQRAREPGDEDRRLVVG